MKTYKRALIVDDDSDLCLLLKAMLDNYIPEIEYVHDMQTCKKLLANIHPDVIFLDNNLPDGKGVKFIKEIKMLSPATKLIIISAMTGLKQQALEDGADIFIEKPLTEYSVHKALGVS